MQATLSLVRVLATIAATTFSSLTQIQAQCELAALPGPAAPGPLGSVHALLALPNGDLFAGGRFRIADRALASNVARWNGVEWLALGDGVDGDVFAATVLPNGDLVVGGQFSSAGSQPAANIARWNGSAWSDLGGGIAGRVHALLVLPNGDLLAGGEFLHAGGVAASRIARWDGGAWSSFGGGGCNNHVYALAQLPNGDVLAGGTFTIAGAVASRGIARWDGTAWSAVPGLDHPSSVLDVAPLASGGFAIAGLMSFGATIASVAQWSGTAVVPLPAPPQGNYRAVQQLPNGDLVAGGSGSNGTGVVSVWNGSAWTSLGSGAPRNLLAFALAPNGDLLAGGSPADALPTSGQSVRRFDGATWSAIGAPQPAAANLVAALPSGDLVVAGAFQAIEGVPASNIARWNGSSFAPVGAGLGGPVRSLTVTRNGTLFVSGEFATAGGGPATRIARWNGTAWSSVGAGLPAPASSLAALDTGEILALVEPLVYRFDGSSWQPLAVGSVTAIGASADAFVLGGVLAGPTGIVGCLVLAGTTLLPVQQAPDPIALFGRDADGYALAASFGSGWTVHRLVGTTFTQLGTGVMPAGFAQQLGVLPNGDPFFVVAATGDNAVLLQRFDGSQWTPFGPSLARSSFQERLAAAANRRGELMLAGNIAVVDGLVSAGLSILWAPCAPLVTTLGSGCIGRAGLVRLFAENEPWAGGTFRTIASGMAAQSLAVHVLGTQATVLPLPAGAPGCALYTQPAALALLVPSGGAVKVALAVPADPGLAGMVVQTQVVGVELAGTVRLTSSNALEMRIGVLFD